MKRLFAPALAVSALVLSSQAVVAGPLGLSPQSPWLIVTDVSGTYGGGVLSTGVLADRGFDLTSVPAYASTPLLYGTFSLTAALNPDGTVNGAGISQLTVTLDHDDDGVTAIPPTPEVPLFTSVELKDFGWDSGLLEFVFVQDATPGALLAPGSLIGVKIFGTFTPDLAGTFSFSSAKADVFAVPSPSAAVGGISLMGGLLATGAARRRRS